MKEHDLKRNIRLMDLATVCHGTLFMIPVIVPFYTRQLGLDFGDFMLSQAVFAGTIVLLEVPTGWISDVWRRKTTLMTGVLIAMTGHAVLTSATNLATALLSEVVMGVGYSLLSGTFAALLYDWLLSAGQTERFTALEGRRSALGFYAVAIASLIGGWMYDLNPYLPFCSTVIALSLGLFALSAMDEPERHKKRPEKHPIADMVETVRYSLHGHPDIGLLVLYGAILFSTTKILMWSQQPYYMALRIDESLFGVLSAGGFVMAGIASHLAHRAGQVFSSRSILTIAWVAALAIALLAGIKTGWHGVALLMIGGSCIYGLTGPHISNIINAHTGSARRATVLSTVGLGRQVVFIPVSYVIGEITDRMGIGHGLLGVSCWLGLTGLMLGRWALRRQRGKTLAAA